MDILFVSLFITHLALQDSASLIPEMLFVSSFVTYLALQDSASLIPEMWFYSKLTFSVEILKRLH